MHQKPYLGTCLGLWTSDKNFRKHPVRERNLSTIGIKMYIKIVIIDNYGNHKE